MTVISRVTAPLIRSVCANTGLLMTVLALALTAPPLAHADAVVTLCHFADELGSGVNLRNALLATPDPNTLINTITFQCNGPATITADSLNIVQPTVIDGGRNITLISFFLNSPIVVANPGSFTYLNNLTLRNVSAGPPECTGWLTDGCGGSVVYGQGVIELHHVLVDSSHIPVSVTSGTLAVFDSQFTGNSEAVIVAAPGVTSTTIDHSVFQNNLGAAPIKATGSINITNSQFINNDASILEGSCKVTIDRSTFQDNKPNGALAVRCESSISHSTFANNAGSDGGAIFFTRGAYKINLRAVRFLSNSASGTGGAIALEGFGSINTIRKVVISYSAFTGNRATTGGAIAVNALPGLRDPGLTTISAQVVSFSRNIATADGGAIHGTFTGMEIARGTFADNTAGSNGGAVFLSNSFQLHSVFANTLFVRNSASSGSAFYGDDADFVNSTVDSNAGLAIANKAPHQPAHIRFTNSIISNNPQGGCGPAGLFDDTGHNLQFPGADCGASIRVANPHLDTMYIPLPKSPPMGYGILSVCMSPPINGRDVYGLGRPSGGACTTGAAEGDIQVLVNRRTHKGRPGQCDCDTSLLKQLQRGLPFVP